MAKLVDGSTLFPILQPPLTGLARLAAEAEHADDGHLIEFRTLEVRSILNRSISKRQLSLAYSINPYRGCEFACRYCYARYTHEFLEPAPAPSPASDPASPAEPQTWATAFERRIFLKQNAAWLLEQELRRIDPSPGDRPGHRHRPLSAHRAPRAKSPVACLRSSPASPATVLASSPSPSSSSATSTCSPRSPGAIRWSFTSPSRHRTPTLARKLEPRAPRPDLRLRAVRRLRDAGLTAGILCSPLLPGITDTASALDRMARQAAAGRASFFAAQPLFLKSCSRPTYLSFVREHFPHLLDLYCRSLRRRPTSPLATTVIAWPPWSKTHAAAMACVSDRATLC